MEKKTNLTPEQIEDAKRLKAIYEAKKKELGISQQDIADALGISQGAVGHYLNGRNQLNTLAAAKFAEILQVKIEDFSPSLAKQATTVGLATLALVPVAGSALGSIIGGSVGYAADAMSKIMRQKSNIEFHSQANMKGTYPVISWVSAGEWAEACEPYELHEIDEWYESTAHVEGPTFWLRVKGDSMTSPVGLSIPEGMLILVDTGKEPKNGSLVVAKLIDANEATFKKYVVDEGIGAKYLQPLNPTHPRVQINGNCKIIGVAVQMMMNLG